MKDGAASRRRLRVGAGSVLCDGARTIRITGVERGPDGMLVATVADGEQVRRVRWVDLLAESEWWAPLSAESATDADERSAELVALSDQARARVTAMARHLRQASVGSPDGNLPRARALGRVDERYDPRLVPVLLDRLTAKSLELTAAGWPGADVKSLYRKLALLNSHGVAGLIDRRATRHQDVIAAADPEVLDAVSHVVTVNAARAQLSVRKFLALARVELDDRGLSGVVTDHQLRSLVGELTRGRALHRKARSRLTHANRPTGEHRRLHTSRPGELVQIDATPSNVHVWFPDHGWGPAVIMTAIDVYTRQVLALRVIPGAASTRDTALLLWDVCRPVVTSGGWPRHLRRWHGLPTLVAIDAEDTRLPAERTAAPVLGRKAAVLPATVVIDHGSEFDAEHFLSACARNGIEVLFARPRTPTDKAIVESWHYTLDQVLRTLPGYKGPNPLDHPVGAEAEAAITAADLQDMLWTWILTVYHDTPHPGLRDVGNPRLAVSPNLAYDRFIELGGALQVPEDPYRVLAFLSRERRVVQDAGIHMHGRVFSHPCLVELRARTQRGVGKKARSVVIAYDRWDLSRIYLQHPLEGHWVCVEAASPSGAVVPPTTETLMRAALRRDRAGQVPPARGELFAREVALLAAWNAGVFADRNDRRLHALEQARQAAYAHDVDDWGPLMRDLAFPALPEQARLPATASPLGEQDERDERGLDDEEVFGFDADELDGLAL